MKAAAIISPVPLWCAAPASLVISCNEVHVWRATLDRTPLQIRGLFRILSADERAKAERFYVERDRRHFVVARGVLRTILSRYLNQAPEALSFCYGPHGKPALAGESDGAGIRFNLSHSRELALYAITRGREVGIDVEGVRADLVVAEIAAQFFSPRELAMLQTLPADEQRQAFFRCWTRKEAYIKARGDGLSMRLDGFDVSLAPGQPAAILGAHRGPSEASRWLLRDLAPIPGSAAALAVEGHGCRLRCWLWPDEP